MIEYEVCSFNNSKSAYEHISENPDKYSLLILDYEMPDMNGLMLATKLLEINPKINVILLSDFNNLKCSYKFNVLKHGISIFKLINTVNESISKSIRYDNKLYI